jgi:hypothetical protein
MNSHLYILCDEKPAAADESLAQIARFHGLNVDVVLLSVDALEIPKELCDASSAQLVLAFSAEMLLMISDRVWFSDLLEQASFIFVYGFGASGIEAAPLNSLPIPSEISMSSIKAGSKKFTVHAVPSMKSFPVCGLSWTEETGSMSVFADAGGDAVESCISVDGHPLLLKSQLGNTGMFLLSELDWVDLDMDVDANTVLRPWYVQLVATTVFLRVAFGASCWSSPGTGATFIIDDPGLKKSYGFLNYGDMQRVLSESNSSLSVAFIPFNFRRSDPETVRQLRRHADRFSIAVHGCDHTGGEYASDDQGWLTGTTQCALDRMKKHEESFGMPFDNIMIFPQGRFSRKVIAALKTCGLEAVVNSTPWPVDSEDFPRLKVRDLLDVAVMHYDLLPIFVRRYPRDIFDFAFDALFQKPILVVEHHQYFRDGYGQFVKFVSAISALSSGLKWMPLGEAVRSSFLLRQIGESSFHVKHFAPTFLLKNPIDRKVSLTIEKAEQEGRVKSVLVGGEEVPFEVKSGILRYSSVLAACEKSEVSVRYQNNRVSPRKTTLKYRLRSSSRRILSDFRDNTLAKNERILSIVQRARTLLSKQKKD